MYGTIWTGHTAITFSGRVVAVLPLYICMIPTKLFFWHPLSCQSDYRPKKAVHPFLRRHTEYFRMFSFHKVKACPCKFGRTLSECQACKLEKISLFIHEQNQSQKNVLCVFQEVNVFFVPPIFCKDSNSYKPHFNRLQLLRRILMRYFCAQIDTTRRVSFVLILQGVL